MFFFLLFCLSSGVFKKLQQEAKTRKKKHIKLLYLAKNKLGCVEMLVSKSVQDGIIDHNEFLAIMNKKKDYDCQKNEVDGSKLKELEIVLLIKNIFDLVDKEIKDKFKDRPTKEQIKKYKKYGSERIEGIKHIYADEDVVILVIMGANHQKQLNLELNLGLHNMT